MAVRLNNRHQDSVRAKIQGSQLVNRLQNHALGKVEMSATQVQSAKILLDKLVSNAPTDINQTIDASMSISKIEIEIVDSKA